MDSEQAPQEEQRERYRELLEELRTIIPGAEVLFAFLLTVPFASRFSELDRAGRIVFAVSLLSVSTATLLFLAPAAYHRIVGHGDRTARLSFGVRTALAGMTLVAVSITCAVFVVVRFLFGLAMGTAAATGVAVIALVTWGLIPFARRPERGEGSS